MADIRRLATVATCTLWTLVIHAAPASAGMDVWTSQGPFGGLIDDLAIDPSDPSIVYAGTNDGLFKTATRRHGLRPRRPER